MFDLRRWGIGRWRPTERVPVQALSDDGYQLRHTRRRGRSGTKAPALLLSPRPNRPKVCCNRRLASIAELEWGRRSRERHRRWICRSPHSPAHPLFQSQFTATACSDNGVRVSFKADGGGKRTFARRDVLDLMDEVVGKGSAMHSNVRARKFFSESLTLSTR
jgi:hypothetical protein